MRFSSLFLALVAIPCLLLMFAGCAGRGKVYSPEELAEHESQEKRQRECTAAGVARHVTEERPPYEIEAHTRAREIALLRARIEEELGLEAGSLARQWQRPYLLVPGDVLNIEVVGQPEFTGDRLVMPDGNVNLPFLGMVHASGLTVEEFQSSLLERLKKFIREPRATVVLKSQGARTVTVVGPLPKAGVVNLSGQESLLEVLTAAGWTREALGARRVIVFRGGRCAVIELEDVLELRDPALNIRLEPNDIIVFSAHEPIFVNGEVARPGPYTPRQKMPISVNEALVLAGGYKETADLSAALVVRADGQREVRDINQQIFSPAESEPLLLYPGDSLYLPSSPMIGVYVFGMVVKPGLRRVPKDARVSHLIADAIPQQFGAALSAIKIVRGYGGKDPIVIGIDVDALMAGDTTQDVELREGDVVYVPETLASDVIDAISRILAPISGTIRARTEFYESEVRREELNE